MSFLSFLLPDWRPDSGSIGKSWTSSMETTAPGFLLYHVTCSLSLLSFLKTISLFFSTVAPSGLHTNKGVLLSWSGFLNIPTLSGQLPRYRSGESVRLINWPGIQFPENIHGSFFLALEISSSYNWLYVKQYYKIVSDCFR